MALIPSPVSASRLAVLRAAARRGGFGRSGRGGTPGPWGPRLSVKQCLCVDCGFVLLELTVHFQLFWTLSFAPVDAPLIQTERAKMNSFILTGHLPGCSRPQD